MKTIVLIPTYNEKANLKPLVQQLLADTEDLGVCIIDDQSPDGTGEVAEALARSDHRIHVIQRQGKGGRGSAVLEGFRFALKENADFIMEMDADFSHDPADVHRFLEEMKQADLVIGSRYLPGSVIENWPLSRRLFSRLANAFARFVLKIPISDYTNGYRCYSRQALQKLDMEKITAQGFIVLSHISYQLYLKGQRFREIPIRFINRKRGSSNFSLKEIVHAWTEVLKLKWSYKPSSINSHGA